MAITKFTKQMRVAKWSADVAAKCTACSRNLISLKKQVLGTGKKVETGNSSNFSLKWTGSIGRCLLFLTLQKSNVVQKVDFEYRNKC